LRTYRSTICVDHVGAVVLLVRLAVYALSARPDLSTNTDSVALLELGDLVTDLENSSYNLVAHAKRKGCLAPSTSDGVNIGTTDTTSINSNVDIVLLERLKSLLDQFRIVRRYTDVPYLKLELLLVKFGPLLV